MFLLLFLVSLLMGCSFSQPLIEIKPPLPEEIPNPPAITHSEEITNVVQEFTVAAKNDHRVHLMHANTFFKSGINIIQLQFISQDIIEMCEARELIVDLTEGLLAKLNQNPILGPDFANFPFRPSNLEIYITFESYYGKYVDPFYIGWICLEDAVVTYYTFDLLDHVKNCWHKRVESYATSREIVVYQRQAEHSYDEQHYKNVNIFGPERYFPERRS